MKKVVVAIAIFLWMTSTLLVTSCGTESVRRGAEPAKGDKEYNLEDTGRSASESLGGNAAAAYAILEAGDNGFSPYQIARAIDEGRLDESGHIEGVVPAWRSGNALSEHNSTAQLKFATVAGDATALKFIAKATGAPSSRSDFEQIFQEIRDRDQAGRWLVWLLGATGAGYSIDQITGFLGVNQPLTDLSPPTAAGVPVIVDRHGVAVIPDLPADWPYRGRSILIDLQQSSDLSFDDNLTVLIIGLVNAGYSANQISHAITTDSIGMCSTESDSDEGAGVSQLTPCYIQRGGIISPDQRTNWIPDEVLIENVVTQWPINIYSQNSKLDNKSKLESGKEVSLKLTPWLASPDTKLAIKTHDFVIKLVPTRNGVYDITGSFRIELIQQTSDTGGGEKGETWVIEGEIYSDEPSMLLSHLRVPTDYTVTHFTTEGQVDWKKNDSSPEGFTGSLDDDLEGDGFLINGVAIINWETEW